MMEILIAAIPVACIAWTVTQEEVFKEIRDWFCRIRDHHDKWYCRKAAYMPTCYYCFSHYVSAAVVLTFNIKLLSDNAIGYIPAIFAIVAIANIYMTIYHILRQALKFVGLKVKKLENQRQQQKAWAA